ncbi:hypothetical protein HanOQP8_Chr05g0190131 [Helianthus annuus]|nr:hypothetical protein HanOQP8_Chr05g0190131 [Helianthus annuus]
MAKMTTRSSPANNPKKESPQKSQGLIKNPSMELCHFTDLEIDQLCHCFPDGTIFQPFDSTIKSDCEFESWATFPAAPFQIGYNYPFPAFMQSFLTLTSLCYIQAMPMLWRVLFTLEHIIEDEAISLSNIQDSPITAERLSAFWNLNPATRTFQPRIKDSEEVSSTSYTMSSAAKSSKSASKFGASDIQDIVSPISIKKESWLQAKASWRAKA